MSDVEKGGAAMPMATATAMPVQPIAVATVMPVQPMAVASAVPMAHTTVVTMQVPGAGSFLSFTRATTPPGMWFEELCNCCNDCCLCWAVFACPCVTAPQLHERISGEPGSCTKWTIILASLVVTAQILSSLEFRLGPILSSVVELIYAILITKLLISVRAKIRAGDNIPAETCPENCDDCCCTFFCQSCSMFQMFHHVGVKGTTGYQLSSKVGSDQVPANYGPNGPYGIAPGSMPDV